MSNVSVQDLEALVEQFRRSDWREMHLRIGEVELFLSTDGSARLPDRTRESDAQRSMASAPPAATHAAAAALAAPPAGEPSSSGAGRTPEGWVQVRAPSLGTFYGAPKPGAPKFAAVGTRVTAESELCLIEVMKLFTTMRADVAGVVREVYVEDGELVEFDQPLFLIEPDA